MADPDGKATAPADPTEDQAADDAPHSVAPRHGRRGEEKFFLTCFPAEPILLDPGRAYSIGRAEGNNIVLADADVSRHHAVLAWDDARFVLKDLGSRNGCQVNRARVVHRVLNDNDRIKIGNRVFTFMARSEAEVRKLYLKRRDEPAKSDTEAIDMETRGAPQQGFAGSVAEFGLPELIQTLELNLKTGVLTVVGDHGRGTVTVRDGNIIAAELGALRAEEAVYELMGLSTGFFEFDVMDKVPADVEIKVPTSALLMEGLRRLDELQRQEASAAGES